MAFQAAAATATPAQQALHREALAGGFAGRPGYGTVGKPFNAIANNYEITTLPKDPFHHYDGARLVLSCCLPRLSRFLLRVAVEIISASGRPVPKRIYKLIVVNMMTASSNIFIRRGIYDGNRNLWLPFALPPNASVFPANAGDEQGRPGQPPRYMVKLRHVAVVDVSVLTEVILSGDAGTTKPERESNFRDMASAVMILNAAFQMVGRELYTDNTNRKSIVYHRPPSARDLDSGVLWLEMWVGHYQSVRPSMNHLTVNIDTTYGMMYRGGNLLNLVLGYRNTKDVRDLTSGNMGSVHQLERFLKNLLVIVKRNATNSTKAMKIVKIVLEGAQYKFDDSNGDPTTIASYFRRVYGRTIQYPDIFCVAVGHKNNVVPLELCEVLPGQIYRGHLPPAATSKAVQKGKDGPGARMSAIVQAYKDLKYGESDLIRGVEMTVANQPLQLQGLRKAAPILLFYKDKPVTVSNDSSFTLPGRVFWSPARVSGWAVIYFSDINETRDNSTIARRFASDIREKMGRLGLKGPIPPNHPQNVPLPDIPIPNPHISQVSRGCNIHEHMRNIWREMRMLPALVIGIMSHPSDADQIALKRFGDIDAGIATQVIIRCGAADDYLHNVLAKINVKLNGINWALEPKRFPWYSQSKKKLLNAMIIGADVSHPPPMNTTSPSICGVVATMHPTLMKYVARSSVQMGGARCETILGLAELLQPIFSMYRQNCGPPIPPELPQEERQAVLMKCWPLVLVYYRDGVGETQLAEVTAKELAAIHSAMKAAHAEWEEGDAPMPNVTFVVVSKRHHQRFFPRDRDATDRKGNCLPGSVFDKGIAHPVLFDFYLQSQAAIIGTARPAHYVVTFNENPFDCDSIEQLSYDLCYTYQRATRSVSIPAPIYYADLVCRRAKFMFPPNHDIDPASVSTGDSPDALSTFHQRHFGPVHKDMINRMYFV
ncbi:Piwi-domain-containing protein [Exidia glandulosa HHB12029]|uniref:Piwi-domain-containing protein n=1 Tax=Exidia glandulosa HHB12029 TaxID=1314781 RepID=A0A165HMD8_EXIGL|nr:Piwi-domain-containing protein [Exidia glandulosa HHB12029]